LAFFILFTAMNTSQYKITTKNLSEKIISVKIA